MDYSRAVTERERLQQALDATALFLAHEPKTATEVDLTQKARTKFEALFRTGALANAPTITVSKGTSSLTLRASSSVDTAFMKLAGVNNLALGVSTQVNNERNKIEIALVLDNTGSMAHAGKMDALKAAVSSLINTLNSKVVEPDDVKLSIVPFNTEVKISTALVSAPWLRWDVTLENPSFGAGRLPPTQTTWQGCVSDRDQPFDIGAVAPSDHFRRYVASVCHYNGLQQMEPLTTNLELVRARSNAMTPTGNTNIAIGLTMGLATLRSDSPFGATSSSAANVKKFVILLTDGDNTQNRWTNARNQIDDRLTLACNEARGAAVGIYTIRVIQGNEPLLRSCATNPSMYYNVEDASQLTPVFQRILESIGGIRIAA